MNKREQLLRIVSGDNGRERVVRLRFGQDNSMSNAVIRRSNGLIKIDKDATTKRIDPVDAVLCGYKLAMYHDFGTSYIDAIDAFLGAD